MTNPEVPDVDATSFGRASNALFLIGIRIILLVSDRVVRSTSALKPQLETCSSEVERLSTEGGVLRPVSADGLPC